MSIAGHVSRAMLSRYSPVRMEAKRRALDKIAALQCAADERRQKDLSAIASISMLALWLFAIRHLAEFCKVDRLLGHAIP
jgi:hypothetical protein